MKKILCMTGTRADYPRIKSVLKEITSNNFNLKLVVTGSHLSKKFGFTINEILEDKFKIYKKIKILNENFNTHFDTSLAISKLIKEFSNVLKKLKPDLVLLTVDRFETLACAVASSTMNFPIAHIQGGEVTGTYDETIRHAVTKLSHIHFAANNDAKKRIIKLGENKNFVFNVGCPFIDEIKSVDLLSKKSLFFKYNLNLEKKTILFIQHPVTTEYHDVNKQISKSIKALKNFKNSQVLCILSNFDAGNKRIISALKKQRNYKTFANLKNRDFLSFLKHSDVLVGNSSSAIREAPSFKLPAVNIGTRQNNRLKAKNVIDVPNNTAKIIKAVNKALYDKVFIKSLRKIKNPYGDGNSAKKIIKILKKINFDNIQQKTITY